jgi:hypothetical protein
MRRPGTLLVAAVVAAALSLVALVVPAAAGAAGAEQFVIPIVDEEAPWDFDDPCTGDAVHGVALENGFVRVTELGDQGHHVRADVRGVVDLFDSDGNFVGTWTYDLRLGDQFPPDAQGAVLIIAIGPLEYADGHTAIVQTHTHQVFEKGDIVKREFFKATCGGR